VQITYDDDSTPPNEDNNNNYDLITHSYTAPSTGGYTLNLSTIVDDFSIPTGGNITIRVYVGTGINIGVDTFQVDSYTFPAFSNQTSTRTFDLDLVSGDVVSLFVDLSSFTGSPITANIKTGSYFDIQRKSILSEGDNFNINDLIPDDYYLLDVINDITRMFNLYYWTDVKTKTIYVENRDSFFKPKSQALNWTDKLSIDKKYEIDYVSSYKRNLTFGYKDLDSDEWLKGWQRVNKRKYAEYSHVLPDRFGEGVTNIKLDLFSAPYAYIATEATPIFGSSFDINRSFTTLKIWNEYKNDGSQPEERINSYNPKIFFFEVGFQSSKDGTNRAISLNGATTFAYIPYGIFEAYDNVDTPINLSFTNSVDTNGNEDIGLFSRYYSNMLKNIEEGGRLVAYFNLDNVDIENLDFRNLIYIDGPDEAKGYYLIESVIDFNPIDNTLTKVSLFKFENLGSVPIDSSQGGNNGNSNNDNGNNPPNPQPIFIEDGSQLIEVWIEDPITGNFEPVYK
jgi:hypothetical protein